MKTILNRNHAEAFDFFLRNEAYVEFDLPPYFNFSRLLKKLSLIRELPFNHDELGKAKKVEEVNHSILSNKDGKYAWRKLELVHPALYVSLAKVITEKKNWEFLKKRFKKLQSDKSIVCTSVPVYSSLSQKQKALQVSSWIENTEKESIRLGLDYEYIVRTDVVDCYGAIYTHSISWAIHGKKIAKKNRSNFKLLGNKIDHHIQAMNYGQTNGIPQGSILMDFIAEIVLSYADKILSSKLKEARIRQENFHIIRFRDDYIIFIKKKNDGDEIIKILSSVLADLGMRLNVQKTAEAVNIPTEIIKKDKYYFLSIPLLTELTSEQDLKNTLLIIFQANVKFPTSGAVLARLTKLYKLFRANYRKIKLRDPVGVASILLSLAMTNPKCFPIIASFVSIVINKLSKTNQELLMNRILRKTRLLPNYGLLEVWLQRITLKISFSVSYKEKLCKVASFEIGQEQLFASSWITSSQIHEILNSTKIFSLRKLKSMDKIIPESETQLFDKVIPS